MLKTIVFCAFLQNFGLKFWETLRGMGVFIQWCKWWFIKLPEICTFCCLTEHPSILQIAGNMSNYSQIAGIPAISGKLASLFIQAAAFFGDMWSISIVVQEFMVQAGTINLTIHLWLSICNQLNEMQDNLFTLMMQQTRHPTGSFRFFNVSGLLLRSVLTVTEDILPHSRQQCDHTFMQAPSIIVCTLY